MFVHPCPSPLPPHVDTPTPCRSGSLATPLPLAACVRARARSQVRHRDRRADAGQQVGGDPAAGVRDPAEGRVPDQLQHRKQKASGAR